MRAALIAVILLGCVEAEPEPTPDPPTTLTRVGHHDLGARGMNSAIALAGDHVYVGTRNDAGPVLILDVSDPTRPERVGEIGPPWQAQRGMSSRELRAVPDLDLLFVLNFSCSVGLHACTYDAAAYPETGGAAETDHLAIYDISDPVAPVRIARHDFGSSPVLPFEKPHEFFVWREPGGDRLLVWVTTPVGPPALKVVDATDPSAPYELTTFDPHDDGGLAEGRNGSTLLHSLSVTPDGATAHLAHLRAGLLTLDVSAVSGGATGPMPWRTPTSARFDYAPPEPSGPHSAVQVPGRDLVVLTDEVYPVGVMRGCPWGWMRVVDVSDLAAPRLAGEFKLPENEESECADDRGPVRVAFTAHNPTLTPSLAFVTWYAGGLQVVDLRDPEAPVALASFVPEPLPAVAVEDPALGGHPVEMWSYPILRDGLVYVVDARNGLYILRYEGVAEDELAGTHEGNSAL